MSRGNFVYNNNGKRFQFEQNKQKAKKAKLKTAKAAEKKKNKIASIEINADSDSDDTSYTFAALFDSGSVTLIGIQQASLLPFPITQLETPVTLEMAVTGHDIVVTRAVLVPNIGITTRYGRVILRDVLFFISEDNMDEVLIGRDVMERLGITPEDALDLKAKELFGFTALDEEIEYEDTKELDIVLKKILADAKTHLATDGYSADVYESLHRLVFDYRDIWRTGINDDPPLKSIAV